MYARSTTLQGNAGAVDDLIAYVRDEVMPRAEAADGFVGMSMLCDREAGRCIVTTAWATEEAMRASGEALRDTRTRGAEIIGAPKPQVEQWEIAAMHRVRETGDGACARVIWCQAQHGALDRILEAWRTTIPPQLEQMDGFCAVSVLVDRDSARAVAAVSYESRAAMDRSAERGLALRDRFAASHGFDITDVAEFDIVLAHLRVPELV
ncbi:antibiotic biosynthesis monooxygenase family protein [Geodermatophilus sp. URMC 64]